MLLSDTCAFVNKSRAAGSSGHGLRRGWQSALSPYDVDRSGCQRRTIIYYSERRSVIRHTRQPNLTGLLLRVILNATDNFGIRNFGIGKKSV